jgi:hypothetical protein
MKVFPLLLRETGKAGVCCGTCAASALDSGLPSSIFTTKIPGRNHGALAPPRKSRSEVNHRIGRGEEPRDNAPSTRASIETSAISDISFQERRTS